MPEVLKNCKVSKSMSPVRCRQNMAEAEEMFGAKARECNSCPCDVGIQLRKSGKNIPENIPETIDKKEEVMANIEGTCINCERSEMKIDAASKVCGSCRTICAGTTAGTPEREAALKKARDKYKGIASVLRRIQLLPVIPPEAGIQLFASFNSGFHLGLKCNLSDPSRRRSFSWNLISVRIGGSHANL
jgi:hypothetical protein